MENVASMEHPPKSKRVCMIAYTNYATDGRVRLEAETLAGWGYEVYFLPLKEGLEPRNYLLRGVKVRELNVRKYRGKGAIRYLLSYLAFLILAFVACTSLFIEEHISVVHVHNMPNLLVFAALVPRMFGARVILDIHDTVLETFETKFGTSSRLLTSLLQFEERVSCWLAHRIVCVNYPQRDAVVRRGIPIEKIAIIHTMPRFEVTNQAGNSSRQPQAFRIVNHGTMSKRLGIDLAVEAIARLAPEIPNLEFHIFGNGDDLDEVVAMAKSLGITDRVHFRGVVPWSELPAALETMDAGIVANRRNVATELMLPSKLIDYVVLGIPAIVPRLNAIQFYFSEDMVSFFEPEDVDSMMEAIRKLYRDNQRRRLQTQKARTFLDKYGWAYQQNSLWGLYNEAQALSPSRRVDA